MPFDNTNPVLTPAELLKDSTHLRAWLESKEPNEIVSTAMCAYNCVCATFLKEMGIKRMTVGMSEAYEWYSSDCYKSHEYNAYQLPKDVVNMIDRLCCMDRSYNVTAAEALHALTQE